MKIRTKDKIFIVALESFPSRAFPTIITQTLTGVMTLKITKDATVDLKEQQHFASTILRSHTKLYRTNLKTLVLDQYSSTNLNKTCLSIGSRDQETHRNHLVRITKRLGTHTVDGNGKCATSRSKIII